MALSSEAVEDHITRWEGILRAQPYPYRQAWPSRLYHHTQMDNLVSILRSGEIFSRAMLTPGRFLDIAPENIVNSRPDAHAYARLYFRPASPTQYRIEGIRKGYECYNGKQADRLCVLVFDSRSILTLEGVKFSKGNMQSLDVTPGDTEQYFSEIDFSKVYHCGSRGYDESVKQARCAEVLVPPPLKIQDHLQAIVCRSPAERDTLLYLLGADANRWVHAIFVSSDMSIFNREYSYLSWVSITSTRLSFAINPRDDGREIDVQIEVADQQGRVVYQMATRRMESTTNSWYVDRQFGPGPFLVTFVIDGCLAFKAWAVTEEFPF